MIKTYERFLIKLWDLKGKRITRKHIKHEIKTQYNLERNL